MKNRVGLLFVECDGSIEDLDVKTAIPDDELSLWGAAIRDAIHHAGHGLRMPPAAARGRNAARYQFRRDLNANSSNFLIGRPQTRPQFAVKLLHRGDAGRVTDTFGTITTTQRFRRSSSTLQPFFAASRDYLRRCRRRRRIRIRPTSDFLAGHTGSLKRTSPRMPVKIEMSVGRSASGRKCDGKNDGSNVPST